MVTKGIITSIDFGGNTCEVRMPYFENAGNNAILGTAIFSNTPGSYNGYKVGDVVVVAFEDGQMDNPVVIGKLYLGAEKEKADPRGSLNVETSSVAKSAAIPADTNLLASIDQDVAKTTAPYASLFSVANELNTLKVDVGQQSRLFANMESVVDELGENGEALLTKITQTSEAVVAEASRREAGDEALQSSINIQSDRISAEAGRSISRFSGDETGAYTGLGWDLSLDAWRLYKKVEQSGIPDPHNVVFSKATEWDEDAKAYVQYVTVNNNKTTRPATQTLDFDSLEVSCRQEGDKYYWYWSADDQDPAYQNQPTGIIADSIKPILTADESGLSVLGTVEAINGHIGDFTIDRGIYNGMTSMIDTAHNGVYIGPEGIALGKGAFTVTSDGVVTISGYVDQNYVDQHDAATKDAAVDKAVGDVTDALSDDESDIYDGVTTITNSTITTTSVHARNLEVNAANIQGTLTASQIDATDLHVSAANIDDKLVATQIDATDLHVKAANIDGTVTAGVLEVKDSSSNIIFKADSEAKTTQIGGFSVASDKLYTDNTSIGTQDSLFLSATGLTTSTSIGGSSGSNS